MSNFGDVLAGLQTTLVAGIPGLQVYQGAPDSVNSYPAAIILPKAFDPRFALSGNTISAELTILVLIASGDDAEGWAQLWDFIDPTTANKSVIKAIETDRTLNGKVDDSEITLLDNFRRVDLGGRLHFGFEATLRFIKTVA